MRKSAILSVFALILVLGLAGQAAALPVGPSAGFGLKAGVNLAKVSDLDDIAGPDVSNEFKSGFVGGGFVTFALGPVNMQVEGLYSQKGGKLSSDLIDADAEIKLSYFEIPVLFKLELPIPAASPYLYAGPSLGFLTKAENFLDEDIKDYVKSTDFGLAMGAGVNFMQFHVDVRYTMGMTDLDDSDDADGDLSDAKNNVFSVTMGMKLFAF